MFDGSSTPLDAGTLIVAVAVVIFSVSLAQLAVLGIAAYIRKRKAQQNQETPGGEQ